MDFAAEAVFDAATPPTRAARAEANGGPTFDEHLQTRAQNGAPRAADRGENAGLAPAEATDATEGELLGGPEQPDSVLSAPPAEQSSSPVLVQLIAAATPAAPQAQANPTLPTSPVAPASASGAPAREAAPADQAAPALQRGLSPGLSTGPSAGQGGGQIGGKSAETSAQASPAQVAQGAPAQAAAAKTSTPQTASPAPQQAPAPAQASASAAQLGAAAGAATAPVTLDAGVAPANDGAAQPPASPAGFDAKAASLVKAAGGHGETKNKAADAAGPAPAAAAAPNSVARTSAKAGAAQSVTREPAPLPSIDAPDGVQPQTTPASPSPAAQAGGAGSAAQYAEAEHGAARTVSAAQQAAREIVRRFEGGTTRFELRLDPPELGRVEIRLDVSRDHRVTAVIAADSPQALTELARSARELEQMLQGAGLELADNGLSFDLRQHGERAETAESVAAGGNAATFAEEEPQVGARPLGYERWRGVSVDMMV